MKSHVAALTALLCLALLVRAQNQAYTSSEAVLTPNPNNICFFEVSENITFAFIDTKLPMFVTRFIPDQITGGKASISSLSVKSLTDGVLVQDVGASAYDKNKKGFLIKQVVYNPNRVASASFMLQYTVNNMNPAPVYDTAKWYFEDSTQAVSHRRVSVTFPPFFLAKTVTANDIRFGQIPSPAADLNSQVAGIPTSYVEQTNTNWAGFVTITYPSPHSTQCMTVEEVSDVQGPSSAAIIGAVFGAVIGGIVLFGIGVALCVGLYWCTHTDHKFKKFRRMYDEE
jgi:hypothetical protein